MIKYSRLHLYLSLMNYPVDKAVDKFVNDLLDLHPKVGVDDKFTAEFSSPQLAFPVRIWILKMWYAYAYKAWKVGNHEQKIWGEVRPTRKTMARLAEYILENAPKQPDPLAGIILKKKDTHEQTT